MMRFIGLSLLVALLSGIAGCGKRDFAGTECASGAEALNSGHAGEAVELFSRCLSTERLHPVKRAEIYKARAKARNELEDYHGAVIDIEASLSLNSSPTQHDFTRYALYLRRAQRLDESLAAGRLAERLDQAKGWITMPTQYHLGWTLFELGRTEEAIAAFSRGIPEQPDYAFAYWRRGLAYERLANNELACRDFESTAKNLQVSDLTPSAVKLLPNIRSRLEGCGVRERFPILEEALSPVGKARLKRVDNGF